MSNFQKKLKGNYGLGSYFASWSSSWSATSTSLDLSNIDLNINIVYLSFVSPACSYKKNSNSWIGTGLDFLSEFLTVKGSIQKLKERGVIVMLSVGGATFTFDVFNPENIKDLVIDLNCDGVDLDWENVRGNMASSTLSSLIENMRNSLPNGLLLSLAAFSTGAYGYDEFQNCQPISQNTGMCIEGIQKSGNLLDWINIMSYDAGINFDTLTAFKSYRKYFKGPLMLGAEVPPEAWGGHIITLEEIGKYVNCILDDETQNNGLFVWSYHKNGKPSCIDIINECINIFNSNPLKVLSGWKDSITYNAGCNVIHNGKKYFCTTTHTSNAYCAPDVLLWFEQKNNEILNIDSNVHSYPIEIFDEWKDNVNYNNEQIVTYNSKKYKCLLSHTSISSWFPSEENRSLWKIM